jgi:hypothetical protein
MNCRLGIFVLALGSVVMAPRLTHAQTAQLSGFVLDESAASVEGALVRIANTETGQVREVKTNAAGQYVAAALANGRYAVTVSAAGFAPVTRAILLDVAQAARLDVTLKVGDVTETVTVSLEARALQSTDGAVSTMIDRRFITALPLNGRSLQSLISLVPGVVAVPSAAGSSGQFSVNGQRADTNAFSIDGVSANVAATGGGFGEDYTGSQPTLSTAGTTSNLVSLDAVQEFRVQTSSFAPEFGRSPGAQVQLITRSGANRLTGAGSYYFRHDAMDASDWFANRAGLPKAKLRHHDVGGVVGGPLRRDRLFYFASHESLNQSLPQAVVGFVPSLALRASAAPTLQGVINAYPLPNGPDSLDRVTGQPTGFAQFTSNHSNTTEAHSTGVRLDATVSGGWTLFTRVQYAPSQSVRRQGASSWVVSADQNALTVTSGLNATLSSRTALEVRGNVSRSSYDRVQDVDTWGGASPVDRGYLFPSGANNTVGDFLVTFAGVQARFASGTVNGNDQRQFQITAAGTHVRGAHVLKVGVDYRRLQPGLSLTPYQLFTYVRSPNDIAIGQVTVFKSVRQRSASRFENVSLFAQDTWSVNQRTTLTYGVRWDINPPYTMVEGPYPLTLDNTSSPESFTLAPSGTRLYDTPLGNVAPRVGVSVTVREHPRWSTVVKAGGGLFFDTGTQAVNFLSYPSSVSGTFGPFRLPLTAAQVAPLVLPTDVTPPLRGRISAYQSDFSTPRSWQWNAAIVQELASNQSLSLTYVGSAGRHLLRQQDYQSPNADFPGGVLLARSDASSSYHGLSLQLTRRMSGGLQALGAYTWSHAIDDVSELRAVYRDRGSASFDVRQAGSMAVSWQLPAPAGRMRGVLSDWTIDGIARWRTALPVDVYAYLDFVNGEVAPVRPDLVSGIPLYTDDSAAPGGRRFNNAPNPNRPGCVGAVCSASGATGDLGRNVFRGFGASQIDVALRRSLPIGGAARLMLSVEVFNALNKPNFGSPDGELESPSYGVATTMLNRALGGLDPLYQIGGPRSIQLGARVTF